jgi:hypothetical protein
MGALRENVRATGSLSLRTPRELLARGARVALWLAIGLLLIRGLGATLAPHDTQRTSHAARPTGAAAWPDDAAAALAVEFATAYLTHVPGEDPTAVAQRLAALASSDLGGELAPRFDQDAPAQAVRSATAANAVAVDRRHALITVAATVTTDGQLTTRRLTVPIARDDTGGLVVDDLPSFAAAPRRAATAPREAEPLMGAHRGAIEDVLSRFFDAYLAGDTGGLAYLVAPGVRIAAAAGRLDLLSLPSVSTVGAQADRRREVLVTAYARDRVSRALYVLRYRVRLVRRDRWYVAELNGPGRGGCGGAALCG